MVVIHTLADSRCSSRGVVWMVDKYFNATGEAVAPVVQPLNEPNISENYLTVEVLRQVCFIDTRHLQPSESWRVLKKMNEYLISHTDLKLIRDNLAQHHLA